MRFHPIERFRRWLKGYNKPDWRTRLFRPFLAEMSEPTLVTWETGESYEYKWVSEVPRGWEKVGEKEQVYGGSAWKGILVRRRVSK